MKHFDYSYFRQALFISRRPYGRAAAAFALTAGALGGLGLLLRASFLVVAAGVVIMVGLGLFAVSLAGLHRFYGAPALRYYRRIAEVAGLEDAREVAEIHIGTYRHARALATLLPRVTIHSVDCWSDEAGHAERSLEEIRSLDPPPEGDARLRVLKARRWKVPIDDAACDAVVLGVGIHEFDSPAREILLSEASRVVRPGGKVVLFEHVRDLRNALVFGKAVGHWPRRDEWLSMLARHFDGVRHVAVWPSVDLFLGRRR